MLMIPEKTQELTSILSYLFKTVTKLVRKNCTSRIILTLEAQDQKEQIMKIEEEEGDDHD